MKLQSLLTNVASKLRKMYPDLPIPSWHEPQHADSEFNKSVPKLADPEIPCKL